MFSILPFEIIFPRAKDHELKLSWWVCLYFWAGIGPVSSWEAARRWSEVGFVGSETHGEICFDDGRTQGGIVELCMFVGSDTHHCFSLPDIFHIFPPMSWTNQPPSLPFFLSLSVFGVGMPIDFRIAACHRVSIVSSCIPYLLNPVFWWRVSRISVSVTRHLATLQVCWPLLFCRSPPKATDNEDGKFGWRHCVQTTGEGYYSATWRCCGVFFCRWMGQHFHWEIPSVHAIYDSSSKRNVLISRNTCLFIHATLKREVHTCMYK